MTQKINFFSIFRLNPDGSIQPLRIVRIGGAQMGPAVKIGHGVIFGGVDLRQYIGRDFSVEISDDGVYVITGIY